MSKPILVTRFPYTTKWEHMGLYKEFVNTSMSDYHHIILRENAVDCVEFEVFNVQDYPQIDFDTLKAKLETINNEPDKTTN